MAIIILYAGSSGAPLIFDDKGFFSSYYVSSYGGTISPWVTRYWPYASFAHQSLFFGQSPEEMRPVNTFLHAACALALQCLLARLLVLGAATTVGRTHTVDDSSRLLRDARLRAEMIALFAAACFALHPVAVFAAAYLVQRSILLATLFSILMWHACLSAWQYNARRWLLWSVVFFYFAVFSKEHAVAAVAMPVGLLLLFWRNDVVAGADFRPVHGWLTLLAYGVIALAATLPSARVLGTDYEPLMKYFPVGHDWHQHLLGLERIHWMSILTQCGLFFKYLGLWLWPDPSALSIDMRESFVSDLSSPHHWWTLLFWSSFLGISLVLIVLGRRSGSWCFAVGLMGVGMLTLWGLFSVELLTVRWQEIFVLYRSYLWMTGLTLVVAAAVHLACSCLARSERGRWGLFLAGTLLLLLLVQLSHQRLQIFGTELAVWDDAVRLIEARPAASAVLPGDERAYYNRGLERAQNKDFRAAVRDYDQAIRLNPKFEYTYVVRAISLEKLGRVEESLADLQIALTLEPDLVLALLQRARTLHAYGQPGAALVDVRRACDLGSLQGCRQWHEWTHPEAPFVWRPGIRRPDGQG
ncbi:MAG: tetratricopeptide repeat protein [Sterolibacterium sp.]|nr:tetratricopeptide repeat protein [Sterolibacterium sp.]